MSAIRLQDTLELTDFYTTPNPMLAATLGTLGFVARGQAPMELYIDAGKLVDLVDAERGVVDDVAQVRCVFEMFCNHRVLGKINCLMVERAHAFAKLSQQRETGDMDIRLTAKIENADMARKKAKASDQLVYLVQCLFDQITNFNIVCSTIAQLAGNPYLKFSRHIAEKGVAHVINPFEVEDSAVKRSRELFRGMHS